MTAYHQSLNIKNEAERLRLIGLIADRDSEKILSKIKGGAFNPHKILDAGCGTGDAFSVIRKVFPESLLIGMDRSQEALAIAKTKGVADTLVAGDLMKLSAISEIVAEAPFDMIYVRNVLLHLPNPGNALFEMKKVARKGGVVFVQASDWETAGANWKDFMIFKGAMIEAMKSSGIDPVLGKSLSDLFKKAGLRDIKKEICNTRITPKDEAWDLLEYLLEVVGTNIIPFLNKRGIASSEEMLVKFRLAKANAESFFQPPAWVIVWGKA